MNHARSEWEPKLPWARHRTACDSGGPPGWECSEDEMDVWARQSVHEVPEVRPEPEEHGSAEGLQTRTAHIYRKIDGKWWARQGLNL